MGKIIATLATVFIAILLATFLVLIFGGVRGQEFCPHTFKQRDFRFHRIPIAKIQVYPTTRTTITSDVTMLLIKDKFIRWTKPLRWDSVKCTAGGVRQVGDADILVRYLDARTNNNELFWLKWTEDNPGLAKELWPEIQRTAESQLYFLMPEVFEMARRASDDDVGPFKKQLRQHLSQEYLRLAESADAVDQTELSTRYKANAESYASNQTPTAESHTGNDGG